MGSVPREFRAVVKRARSAGWAVYLDGQGHVAFRGPDGERTTVPTTLRGGRSRALSNYRAALRRLGVPGA